MGSTDIDDPAADALAPRQRKAFLRRRIDELTAQLDRLNQLFSDESRDGAEDQE
jgi:hypothetical protein